MTMVFSPEMLTVVANYVIPQLSKLEHSVHSLSNILIELDGDGAWVESYWSVVHRIRRLFLLTDVWQRTK